MTKQPAPAPRVENGHANEHREVATQLRELQWRMGEMQRETLLRAWLLPPEDGEVVSELMTRLHGDGGAVNWVQVRRVSSARTLPLTP